MGYTPGLGPPVLARASIYSLFSLCVRDLLCPSGHSLHGGAHAGFNHPRVCHRDVDEERMREGIELNTGNVEIDVENPGDVQELASRQPQRICAAQAQTDDSGAIVRVRDDRKTP
jgi:hypothetical protein